MAAKYFPESKEVWRGHGRKTKSGLRSTKQTILEKEADTLASKGERALLLQIYNLQHEFDKRLYTDQTGTFPHSFKGYAREQRRPDEAWRPCATEQRDQYWRLLSQSFNNSQKERRDQRCILWTMNALEISSKQS